MTWEDRDKIFAMPYMPIFPARRQDSLIVCELERDDFRWNQHRDTQVSV
jgi:hypothetical protein